MMVFAPTDEMPQPDVAVDEWVFATWLPDASAGVLAGYRLLGRRSWYWFAFVEEGHPVFHMTEFDVAVRDDPFNFKAPEMWAGLHCDDPMRQWTFGNEGHAAALDDPNEGLGRAYGTPEPMSSDIEWYAIGGTSPIAHGYEQVGVAHGLIEMLDRPNLEFDDVPAHRWRRWGAALGPVELPTVAAHTGLRAPFAFPDGTTIDWVLTQDGWRSRRPASGQGSAP